MISLVQPCGTPVSTFIQINWTVWTRRKISGGTRSEAGREARDRLSRVNEDLRQARPSRSGIISATDSRCLTPQPPAIVHCQNPFHSRLHKIFKIWQSRKLAWDPHGTYISKSAFGLSWDQVPGVDRETRSKPAFY